MSKSGQKWANLVGPGRSGALLWASVGKSGQTWSAPGRGGALLWAGVGKSGQTWSAPGRGGALLWAKVGKSGQKWSGPVSVPAAGTFSTFLTLGFLSKAGQTSLAFARSGPKPGDFNFIKVFEQKSTPAHTGRRIVLTKPPPLGQATRNGANLPYTPLPTFPYP